MVPTPDVGVELPAGAALDDPTVRPVIALRYDDATVDNVVAAPDRLPRGLRQRRCRSRSAGSVPRPASRFVGPLRRYGADARHPEFGVLDRWNRLHDVPNVVVADSSCFTTGPEKNPTLTAMAIAVRAADQLADQVLGRNQRDRRSALRYGPRPEHHRASRVTVGGNPQHRPPCPQSSGAIAAAMRDDHAVVTRRIDGCTRFRALGDRPTRVGSMSTHRARRRGMGTSVGRRDAARHRHGDVERPTGRCVLPLLGDDLRRRSSTPAAGGRRAALRSAPRPGGSGAGSRASACPACARCDRRRRRPGRCRCRCC